MAEAEAGGLLNRALGSWSVRGGILAKPRLGKGGEVNRDDLTMPHPLLSDHQPQSPPRQLLNQSLAPEPHQGAGGSFAGET